MSGPIYFPNLKTAGSRPPLATATVVGSRNCIDVNVANTVPVPVTPANYAYQERRVHLPATTNIPGNGSAMVELDVLSGTTGGTALAADASEISVSWNGGGIIEIGAGADATAAASNIIAALNEGQTRAFGASLTTGDRIYVRRVESNVAISVGTLVVVLLG